MKNGFSIDLAITKGLLIINNPCCFLLSLKCIFMWISLTSLLQQGTINRNGLNQIIRIRMLYVLFLRDCSSIGQSTALSRRKLRVRAPSVPTDPNPIKKYINISLHFLLNWVQMVQFHSPRYPSFSLFSKKIRSLKKRSLELNSFLFLFSVCLGLFVNRLETMEVESGQIIVQERRQVIEKTEWKRMINQNKVLKQKGKGFF